MQKLEGVIKLKKQKKSLNEKITMLEKQIAKFDIVVSS